MKLRQLGSHVNVSISAAELDAFADTWPCSGMRGARRGITFQFEIRSGDLVDIYGQSPRYDESAVLALSQDASNYAASKLDNPALAR